MFLPNDLTANEKTVVQTTAAQLLERLPKSATDDDRRSARLRAEEIAAEQIWSDRQRSGSTSTDPQTPDSGDARSLQNLIDELNEELFMAEEE